jgi:hypothetical protein
VPSIEKLVQKFHGQESVKCAGKRGEGGTVVEAAAKNAATLVSKKAHTNV